MISLTRRVARALLRSSTVNRAVRSLARARGHRLVLVYHRLGPAAPTGCEVVPSVPVDLFRAQLQALGEVVELVTIDEILSEDVRRAASTDRRRPVVALTFDDDLPSHVDQALPALRGAGVPAAFFLSGRAFHGRGPYWFQHLEALFIAHGVARAAALLGLPPSDAETLTGACVRSADLRRRVTELAKGLPTPAILQTDAIAALAAAGMTVGFHTIDHDIVPSLDDAGLAAAVSGGREDLAAATGAAVRYFAYPYGKTDARSTAAVKRASFDAAFTGLPHAIRSGDDRHRLGRWEPGPIGVDELLVNLAMRLHRVAPASTLSLHRASSA